VAALSRTHMTSSTGRDPGNHDLRGALSHGDVGTFIDQAVGDRSKPRPFGFVLRVDLGIAYRRRRMADRTGLGGMRGVAEARVLDPIVLYSNGSDCARHPYACLIVDFAAHDLMAKRATLSPEELLVCGSDPFSNPAGTARSFSRSDERPGEAFSEGEWGFGVDYTPFQDLVRKEDPQLISNLFGVPMNQYLNRCSVLAVPCRDAGIEFMAATTIAIEANRLHPPAVLFDLVALSATEPFLTLGPIECLGDMKMVVELDTGIFFDLVRPGHSNGGLARVLDDGESNRRMMFCEVARVFEFATRKLCPEITVAGDTIGSALVRKRDFSTSMFEMAVCAGHLVEPGHRQAGRSMSSDVDMAIGAGVVRDAAEKTAVAACAIVLDDRMAANDGARRPYRSQGGRDHGQCQEAEQDSGDGQPRQGAPCKNATFDPEVRSPVEGRAGVFVALSEFVFDADIFRIFGWLKPEGPGADVDLIADGQTLTRGGKTVDRDLLSLRGLDIDVSIAQANRGMVERRRESLEAQIVVGPAADIEGFDLDGVFESDTLSAGAQLDLGQADAH
jgi:hypothetical protein